MPKKQREFSKITKTSFGPVAPVCPEALCDRVRRGMLAGEACQGFDETLAVYLSTLASVEKPADPVSRTMLNIRAYFAFLTFWESRVRYETEGLLVRGLQDTLIMTCELMHAISRGPIRAARGADGLLEIDFDTDDVVREGKRYQAMTPSPPISIGSGGIAKPH